MATYTFEIGGEEWDVEAPDDASPAVMKQIASSLMQREKDMTLPDTPQAPPEAPPPPDATTTTTVTSDTPQLPSAGMLPGLIRTGGAIAAPLVASGMAAGTGGGLTLPGVMAGGSIASGAEALAEYIEKNSFEGQQPEGRKEYSPGRIGTEALMAFIPLKGAKTLAGAAKEGTKAAALATAGLSAEDYFDTGKLPTIKDVGLNFFLANLIGTVGSRVIGTVARDFGPDVAKHLVTPEDLAPIDVTQIPPDRIDEFLNIEKGPTNWGKLDIPEKEFDEFMGVPPTGTKTASVPKRGRKTKAKITALGPEPKPEPKSEPEIKKFLEEQGVSARDPHTSASNLIEQIQRDIGIGEVTDSPSAIGTAFNEIEASARPREAPNVFGRQRSIVGPRGKIGMRPLEGVIADLSQATNTNAYDDYAWVVRQSELKRQYEDLWAGHGTKDQWGLTKIFRWTTPKVRKQMTEYLEATDKNAIIQNYGWSGRTVEKAEQLRSFYNMFFREFGIDGEMFMQNYAPRVRKYMGAKDLATVSEDPRVPKEVLPFFKHARTGHLDVYETDALKAAARYLRAGTFEKFMGGRWDMLRDKYYSLFKNPTNDLTKQELGKEFLGVLETIKGPKTDAMHVAIQDTLDGISKRLGLGIDLDAHIVTENMLNAQNLAYLGGNIPALVRDMFQPFLTAYPKLGPKWIAKGFASAMTKEGAKRAEVAGITRGMTTGMHDVLNITKGPITRGIRAATKATMYPRQMNESIGRAAVYNGMYLKARDALAKASASKWGDQSSIAQFRRFLDYADLDRFHPEIQKDIAGHFLLKDPEAAMDVAARAMVNETMFDYTAVGRPKAIRNTAGKLGLTYAVWPASYTEYLMNFSKYGEPWKIRRDKARLLLSHGAIVGAFGGLGVMAGDSDAFSDAMSQAFYGPTIPGLSGIGNLALSAVDVARGAPGAEAELKYKLKGLYPAAAMVRNVKEIAREQSGFRQIGRAVGFVRGNKPKDGSIPPPRMRRVKNVAEETSLFRRILPNPFK